ncbi:ArsR/SmtB family transcription factor [Streptacidiphilus rugosus]|uniref:ArsR/SmtB family transcription factor n=1 Tax=Streptacidiphilus rugosus TaxID=405783 RepID=UPI00055B8CBC|nr:helix-turn-helix transcriptional regulator [Streptacidiphilus rugosus]
MAGHRPAPQHRHPSEVAVETVFAALADPVRLEIVRQLWESEDWSRGCGTFDVPVGKAGLSHHFAVLRDAGLIEQRDEGARRVNRVRRAEVDAAFPGLWRLVGRPGQ